MKPFLILATVSCAFTVYCSAQSAAPVYTDSEIKTMITQHGICSHDTSSFAWLCRNPEALEHGSPQRNSPQTAPLMMTNPGFESGDFTGWTGMIGDNNSNSFGPLYNIQTGIFSTTLDASVSNSNARHTIMTSAAGNDAIGGFAIVSGAGNNYVARLGGTTPNYQGEIIEQAWMVDPGQAYVKINYAAVLWSGGHPQAQSSYFKYELLDSVGGIIATRFDYSDSLLGYTQYPVDPDISYLPWTSDSVSLIPYIGSTVSLRFTVAGCTQSGHYGYCYVDVFYPYVTGITEISKVPFTIYPNPASDVFEVNLGGNHSDNDKIEILNCLGQRVEANLFLTATGWKVNMQQQPSGIYFITIFSGNERSVQRLVKQ